MCIYKGELWKLGGTHGFNVCKPRSTKNDKINFHIWNFSIFWILAQVFVVNVGELITGKQDWPSPIIE